MGEEKTDNKKSLLRLVVNNLDGANFPQVCLAATGEVARDLRVVSDPVLLDFAGVPFREGDQNGDFKGQAVLKAAPECANAYSVSRTTRSGYENVNYASATYFRINEEQFQEAMLRMDTRDIGKSLTG